MKIAGLGMNQGFKFASDALKVPGVSKAMWLASEVSFTRFLRTGLASLFTSKWETMMLFNVKIFNPSLYFCVSESFYT
jgi:hypothetical protein